MKITIAGAGIGGLTAALTLLKAGFEVRVFERTPALAEVGAGLQIGPNAMHVLNALDLDSALARYGFPVEAFELRLHKSGFRVTGYPLGEQCVTRYGAKQLSFHRADLQKTLADALEARSPGALILGRDVVGVTQTARKATLHFRDGTFDTADVVIGADGLHSKVREALLGPQQAEFTGNVAWRGLVPAAKLKHLNLGPLLIGWMAPNAHAVTYFVRGGELLNFMGFSEDDSWIPESWDEHVSKDELRRAFAGYHPHIREIVQGIEEPYRWPLYDRPPLPRWSHGRISLLGDACHPMLPFMAQGAAQAIEDAAVLANCLASGADDVVGALKRYEAIRLPHTAKVQGGARTNGQMFHLTNPFKRFATYGAMSVVSRFRPTIYMEKHDWLLGNNATLQGA